MRSAFKRSTTLLASARRTGRSRPRQEAAECVLEEPAATAPRLADVQRSSSDGAAARTGPATPKKLDFSSSNSAAHSPDVDQSAKSLQSANSHVSSEISPVLGFINPATVAETAQDAGLTPRDIDAMLTPRAIELSTAAAAARTKLQKGDPKSATAHKLMSSQQQHETTPINKEIFAGAVAVPAAAMPRLGTVRTEAPRTKAAGELPATRLPRSPVVNKSHAHDETSQSTFVSPPPRSATANATGAPSTLSALPRSPFNRLKAALQSQRREFEQDERPTLSPHTKPASRAEPEVDRARSKNDPETVHTACIQNPHFRGHGSTAIAEGGASGPLHATMSLGADALGDGDDVLRGSVSLPGLNASALPMVVAGKCSVLCVKL